VSPRARIVWIVAMKLRPVRIDEKPVTKMPSAVGHDVRRGARGSSTACRTSSPVSTPPEIIA
jgi:hypothetical protein